jgi:hypothetical protein
VLCIVVGSSCEVARSGYLHRFNGIEKFLVLMITYNSMLLRVLDPLEESGLPTYTDGFSISHRGLQ